MSKEVEIDLDLADIRTEDPAPIGWIPEEDTKPFNAKDKDENSDD